MINSQLSIRFQSSLELFPLNEEAETSDEANVVSDSIQFNYRQAMRVTTILWCSPFICEKYAHSYFSNSLLKIVLHHSEF